MARKFSTRPTPTLRGRKFKGPRGWSGKAAHPPLTDFPVAAFVMAAVFDVISMIGRDQTFAVDFFRAGTYVAIAGAAISFLAVLAGFWDWRRSTEGGTQAHRTARTHSWIMTSVTVPAAVNIALRLNVYHTRTHPTIAILVLSIAIAALVSFGAAFGGTSVYNFEFNVDTASDSPVWRPSEAEVVPREHRD